MSASGPSGPLVSSLSCNCVKVTKMQEINVFLSSLACNCVKVTATFFKIEEISKMTHFNIKFL